MTRPLPPTRPVARSLPPSRLSPGATILLGGSWYSARRGGILRLRRQVTRRSR